MPLPRGLARFNRVVTNRLSRPLARWVPGFALIVHRGRRSGLEYRTPVNAWVGDEDVIVALTYGRDTDWLKNLAAADGGLVIAGRETYQVGRPGLIGPDGMSRMPAPARPILRLIEVDEFALLPVIRPDQPT